MFVTIRELNIFFANNISPNPIIEKLYCHTIYLVFSNTTSKEDVQNKEYIFINLDSININNALMTTGTLVLLSKPKLNHRLNSTGV
jgi:hypothetical protein